MLPFSLYEMLPYIYLGVGGLGCAIFDSELILIASVLIILAGFIILWMRLDFRRNVLETVTGEVNFVERSSVDRRQNSPAAFPLVDSSGMLVKVDRRVGERRAIVA